MLCFTGHLHNQGKMMILETKQSVHTLLAKFLLNSCLILAKFLPYASQVRLIYHHISYKIQVNRELVCTL